MALTIAVSVKPHAKTDKIVQVSASEYQVCVKAPPHDGKANIAIVTLLSDYFSVPKSRIKIIRGQTGRKKIVAIG
jgi:uncharacterized protein (TIGR00251 family)